MSILVQSIKNLPNFSAKKFKPAPKFRKQWAKQWEEIKTAGASSELGYYPRLVYIVRQELGTYIHHGYLLQNHFECGDYNVFVFYDFTPDESILKVNKQIRTPGGKVSTDTTVQLSDPEDLKDINKTVSRYLQENNLERTTRVVVVEPQ